MKACFLPIGSLAADLLPVAFSSFSGGITESIRSISVFSVSETELPKSVTGFLNDLNECASALSDCSDISCLKTSYTLKHWPLKLPDARKLCQSDDLVRLVTAIKGSRNVPHVREDADMSEWALRTLLAAGDDRCAPLFQYTDELRNESDPDLRLILLCDLCDSYSVGISFALLQWFRSVLPDAFSGLVALSRASVNSREIGLSSAKAAVSSLAERLLVRTTDHRETRGADAAWILGLPASFVVSDDSYRILFYAASRIAARCFSSSSSPSPGLHTVSIPSVLTLSVLGKEAPVAASFLLSSVWFFSDLFPALTEYLEHPALLRSLAPATKNGLFRRLFRDLTDGEPVPPLYITLNRVLKTILLEELILIRTLPDPLRLSSREEELWQKAHALCGHAVTLGAEYDISRREAELSGIDKVHPVHRVSLADTEEERLQHLLDDMSNQLSTLLDERNAALSELCAFRARQVLEDCTSLCTEAKAAAELKTGESSGSNAGVFARERRLSQLQAAVNRCQSDLKAISSFPALTVPAASRISLQIPFSGEILDAKAAEACFSFLSDPDKSGDTVASIRDHISELFCGYRTPDVKVLFKSLTSVLRSNPTGDPVIILFSAVLQTCSEAVSPWRILNENRLPDVPLLPDCSGNEKILTVSALSSRMIAEGRQNRDTSCRGIWAMLLLRQYRRPFPDDSTVVYSVFRKGPDPALNTWLELQGCDSVTLVSCQRGAVEQAVAVLIPGRCPVPVLGSKLMADLIPSFAVWFNHGIYDWMDPCPYLGESDRLILTEQITRCRSVLHDENTRELSEFLLSFYQDIVRFKARSGDDTLLSSRLKAACGLSALKTWQGKVTRINACYDKFIVSDRFCAEMTGLDIFEPASTKVANETVYSFEGKPFARESTDALLESAGHPEEDLILNTLDTECQLLSRSSDDYRDTLVTGLIDLLARYPEASAEAREIAENLLYEAKLPLSDSVTVLTWPWDTESPTVRTILTECLGERLAKAALSPFSESLAVFPARGGEILGDSLLNGLCVIDNSSPDPEESDQETVPAKDAVLPPLSPDFAAALCRLPEGRTLLQYDFLKFERKNNVIICTLTLQGAFSLHLCRQWTGSDILNLYAHDLPTLALWPSVPFPFGDWKAYFSYAHFRGPWEISAITENSTVPMTGSGHRYVSRMEQFPLCFLLWRDGRSAGAVPNLLPSPESVSIGETTACVDFGSAFSSVLLQYPEGTELFSGASAVRLLINNPAVSRSYLCREFLSPDSFGSVIPANVTFPEDSFGSGTAPFIDGVICSETDPTELMKIPVGRLSPAFSFHDGCSRATELYLHELMLLISFRVRVYGSTGLSWRFSIPDDISREAREQLLNLLRSLTEQVSLESGLFPKGTSPLMLVCSESTAVGAYCRGIRPAETSDGLLALDIGNRSVRMSLYTRNMEEAVRSSRISDGLPWILLPSLLRDPSLLARDFGDFAIEPFRSDLSSLISLITKARTDRQALQQALTVMEAMLVQYGQDLHTVCLNRMSERRPTWTGSLILYFFCRIMMFSALELLPAPSDSGQRVLLPERMPVFLTGSGSILFESMSGYSQSAIRSFLGMFRNPRIQDIMLFPSRNKKLEVVSGIPRVTNMTSLSPDPAPVSACIPIRPENILPEFLLRFLSAFPAEAALLFPNFYTADPYTPFTPAGQQLLSEVISGLQSDRSSESPYIILSSWLSGLPELIRERS